VSGIRSGVGERRSRSRGSVIFLFDENLSPHHAKRLRKLGFDAVSVAEMGMSGADDPAVRATAISSGRVLITMDGDFGNILRYPVHQTPGVIWLRLHPPTETGIEAALDRVLQKLMRENIAGKLAIVDQDKIRIRG
jgi:predicted nuclease of predicted toxin-antitoxin system